VNWISREVERAKRDSTKREWMIFKGCAALALIPLGALALFIAALILIM
jgi:hypothetical protein